MSYQEFKPSNRLENLIESYWLIKDLDQLENQRVLPDACADIIFNLGNSNSSVPRESIAVSGMMTTFSDVCLDPDSELLGVRFKPGQLSKLTKHPLSEIKNKTIEASQIIPELNPEILEQIDDQKNMAQKLALVDDSIYGILSTKEIAMDAIISSVIDFMLHSSKPIIVSKLAKKNFISLRQLERKFKCRVGVGLKEFSRIVRFKQTIKSIANKPNKSLLHIAFDNGYYDHAHLTNEFRHFSGQVPSYFR